LPVILPSPHKALNGSVWPCKRTEKEQGEHGAIDGEKEKACEAD
jgi:hypothetical protein